MSMSDTLSRFSSAPAWRHGLAAVLMGASLSACGGGSDDEAPGAANAHRSMELSGVVSAVSDASSFTLEGVRVDASAAVNTAGPMVVGSRLEVDGQLVDGIFRATRIEREDDLDFDGLEAWGAVEQLDTAQQRFVLRGVAVRYAGARFEDGTAARLANGRVVEVEGRLAADGRSVDAARIDFED